MSSVSADPLADELRASGVSLSHAEWADVHAGRYNQVAQRLLRRAKWRVVVSVSAKAVLAAMLVDVVVRHFHTGPKLLLVSAGSCVVLLLPMVLLSVLVYRKAASVADRLRQAGAEAQRPAVVQ